MQELLLIFEAFFREGGWKCYYLKFVALDIIWFCFDLYLALDIILARSLYNSITFFLDSSRFLIFFIAFNWSLDLIFGFFLVISFRFDLKWPWFFSTFFINTLLFFLLVYFFFLDLQLFLLVFQKLYQEWVNLACSIIWFWLEVNTTSPVRYSCLSNLRDDKGDIFVTSLLISSCSFPSFIWSSIVFIYFKNISLSLIN